MDSLVHQSFRDYEIIVVDDESPDGSMEIVESYRKKDPERIRVFHQKNTRQGGARNYGVTLAMGEYMLFVDSDDYVSPDMLEVVDRKLRETPCDILVFSNVPVDETGEPAPGDGEEALKPGFYIPGKDTQVVMLACGPANKAFRREFYISTGVQFPEKIWYEDSITRLLYARASSIRVTDDPLYFYVQHENSSMNQKISEKMLDILTVVDMTCREFEKARLYDIFRQPLEVALIYSILCIEEKINLQNMSDPMQNQIADFIHMHFKDYRENPYASRELVRVLDCLTAHQFRRYHYRFLLLNRMKEHLLQWGLVSWLKEHLKNG